MTLEKNTPTDVIAFHCQQAVEKYLKAYLTLVDIRAKKTHDLETILNLCIGKDKEFEKLEKKIANEVREFVIRKLKERGVKWSE